MRGLLEYYQRELAYLRESGAEFARRHPRIAKRLEWSDGGSADPQVQRLIESFAFQTARIQHDLENEFPQISTALLDTLFPFFNQPMPSTSVARFSMEAGNDAAIEIPRHAALYSESLDGEAVFFRTAYDVQLWPVEVAHVEFASPENFNIDGDLDRIGTVLQLKLRDRSGEMFDRVDRLRFYLSADLNTAHTLYELIFTETQRIKLNWYTDGASLAGDATVRPVGFEENESLLPTLGHSDSTYRLLAEYFACPEKFLFFDVLLDGRPKSEYLDVLFLLEREINPSKLRIRPEHFLTGCTPVVNLFERSTEPLRVDHRQTEYPLVADLRRRNTTEIHSILEVKASTPGSNSIRPVRSYYDYHHELANPEPRLFWRARRIPSPSGAGGEVLLSLTDLNLTAEYPPEQTVFARALCTNRELARQIEPGAALFFEKAPQPCSISMLEQPRAPVWPQMGGSTLWSFLTLQNLNFLSLGDEAAALRSIREMMRLCSFATADQSAVERQLDGILELHRRRIVLRVGDEAWRGFRRGVELTLVMNNRAFVAGNGYLLAAVLERVLASHISIQSFLRVIVKRENEQKEWKQWPPRTGLTAVL